MIKLTLALAVSAVGVMLMLAAWGTPFWWVVGYGATQLGVAGLVLRRA